MEYSALFYTVFEALNLTFNKFITLMKQKFSYLAVAFGSCSEHRVWSPNFKRLTNQGIDPRNRFQRIDSASQKKKHHQTKFPMSPIVFISLYLYL
jgi:hypothetical protein